MASVGATGCDAFTPSCSGQFSLSTPDFGASRQHQQGQGDQQQGQPPQQPQQQQQSSQKGMSGGGSGSYSSLRNKIKSVQDRYKKSSVTNRFRAKFGAKQGDVSPARNPAPPNMMVGPPSLEVSKFRSHSHGALHSLNEFQQREKVPCSKGEAVSAQEWGGAGKKGETVTTATVEPPPKSPLPSSTSSASSSGSNPSTPRLRGGGVAATGPTPAASSSSSKSTTLLKKKNKGMSMMGKSKSTEAVSAVGDMDEVRDT